MPLRINHLQRHFCFENFKVLNQRFRRNIKIFLYFPLSEEIKGRYLHSQTTRTAVWKELKRRLRIGFKRVERLDLDLLKILKHLF